MPFCFIFLHNTLSEMLAHPSRENVTIKACTCGSLFIIFTIVLLFFGRHIVTFVFAAIIIFVILIICTIVTIVLFVRVCLVLVLILISFLVLSGVFGRWFGLPWDKVVNCVDSSELRSWEAAIGVSV